MAGVITTGNLPRLLVEGVRNVFGQEYEAHEVMYTKMFGIEKSRKSFEVDVMFGGFELAEVKPEGSGIQYDSETQGWAPKYQNVTYAKGFIVSMEAMDDELYGVFGKKARSLAFSMNQTLEVIGANVYNRATNPNYTQVDGDAQPLLSTAHTLGPLDNGTFSNTLAIPAALSETSLEDMAIQVKLAVNSRGLRINLQTTDLIVSPYNEFEAHRILKSVLQNDTANNSTNALRDMGTVKRIIVNPFLTSATAWFMRTNCKQGLIFQERMPVTFDQDVSFDTSNARFKSMFRCVASWTDPRGLYGSAGI